MFSDFSFSSLFLKATRHFAEPLLILLQEDIKAAVFHVKDESFHKKKKQIVISMIGN